MATSARLNTVNCPECGGEPIADQGDGETVCSECGLVVESDKIDHGPEWRNFSDGPNRERCRPGNRNRGDKGMGSQIGFQSGESRQTARLRKWDKLVKDGRKVDRNRDYATTEIQRISEGVELPETIADQGKQLFRQLHKRNWVHGRDLDTIAAGCLYAVARIHQKGVTPDEVTAVARTEKKLLTRRYKAIVDELGLEVPPPDPETRIRVVSNDLDVDGQTVKRAIWLVDRMDESDKYRGMPSTLAAAALYRASDETQTACAEAAGVTPASVRSRLETLPKLGEL